MVKRIARASALIAALAACLQAPAAADEAGYLYSYAISDARYDDRLISLDAYKPLGAPAPLRLYVDVLASQDSRTAGGAIPRIFADNYALGAIGVQYTRPTGFRAFVQAGESFTLGSVAATRSGGDLRAGLQLYREWAAAPARGLSYGNLFASTTYLNRYADVIAYGQLESGRHVFTPKMDLYARASLSLDTHAFYYSNGADLALGVRYRPFGTRGPSFAIEHVTGTYLRHLPRPEAAATYSDFRPTITFGRNL